MFTYKGEVNMENLAEVMKIIEAGLHQDSAKVFNYSQLLINKMDEKGDIQSAKRLRNVLKDNKTMSIQAKDYGHFLKLPVDSESRLPLAEIKNYDKNSVFLSLDEWSMSSIREFIYIINHSDLFLKEGIKSNRSMILFGKPGTGKTQTARYISSETALPLVTVRLDGIISSYLGSTSKNLRTLFDFVQRTPCILFLDEFDAIAKVREDSNELGELKRVVNTLLQNIDSIASNIPIIAATNHEHLLDPAVWRRFDYKIRLKLPDAATRSLLLAEFFKDVSLENNVLDFAEAITEGMNGSELEMLASQIRINLVVDRVDLLRLKDFLNYFINFRKRLDQESADENINSEEIMFRAIRSLRNQDKRNFSIRKISNITGISTGKLSQELRKMEGLY